MASPTERAPLSPHPVITEMSADEPDAALANAPSWAALWVALQVEMLAAGLPCADEDADDPTEVNVV